MYCHNCGSKLNDNEKFCGKCGTKIEKEDFKNAYIKNNKVFSLDNSTKGNIQKMYLILMGMQLIKLILWFVDTFVLKVTVEQLDYELNRSHSLYESYSTLNIVAIPISVISILICVFVIYKKCYEKRVLLIVLKSVTLVSCINYLFILCMSVYDVINNTKNLNNVYGEGMAEVYSGPNFLGIVLLIAIVGSTVLAFNISAKSKILQETPENFATINNK